MRVAVIGGGPAGLYFAILLQRDRPGARITVVERNRPDDTFGFGVVFSDQTLDTFAAADVPSYRAIVENFAYWDDIEIHVRGTVHRIGGNGFCGCSRRSLLMLLHDRARALGIELLFNQEATPEDFPDADLIVAADGINSTIRTRSEVHFQPRTDLRPNRFAWMGSTRPFDAFTFFFKERSEGIFIAHCYQYEPGASTWVLEMEPETFARAGLAHATEAESARFMEHVFAEELNGHKLVTNRSLWRQFPMIRCARWTQGNVVLLGDAKATAHFSIGSGTKLAMEDAIALHAAVMAGGSVADCLARFESWPTGSSGENPARGGCLAGVVRACAAVLADASHAVRVWRDDAGRRRSPTTIWRCGRRISCRRWMRCSRGRWQATANRPRQQGRRCSSRFGYAVCGWRTGSWSRRCANTARRKGCRRIGTWCTTALGRPAERG